MNLPRPDAGPGHPKRCRLPFSFHSLLYLGIVLLLVSLDPVHSGVIRLDAGNFELAVQTYSTLAILFHEEQGGSGLVERWEQAARLAHERISAQGDEMDFAVIEADSPEVADLVASYGFSLPSVQIFRRRVMHHWEGNGELREATVRGGEEGGREGGIKNDLIFEEEDTW
ncbi:hypothetical protein VYU27_001781 [Nannochloropsis oceanica]